MVNFKSREKVDEREQNVDNKIKLSLIDGPAISQWLWEMLIGTFILNEMVNLVNGAGDGEDLISTLSEMSLSFDNGYYGQTNMTVLTDPPIFGYVNDVMYNVSESDFKGSIPAIRDYSSPNSDDGGGGENETFVLPIDMVFNQGHVVSIVAYSILMCISAVGNITVLATIIRLRMKARLNRVNLFLLHLAIADLIVTFLLMPLEIGWASTVSWRAGDATCRIMSFFRIFGLYLSGFILVCISLDRYFAVLKPLALPEANKRGRIMLYAAWSGSIFCSLPQAVIFHVERHPQAQWFEQCVTFNFFSSQTSELAYSMFGFIFLYGFPLAMIISCYTCILYEIFKINNINRIGENLRRSNMGALGRAKIRTLKMTVLIVGTFVMLWMPYNCMSLWYWIDKDSAIQVDQRVQKGLFIFACTNSCFNPVVYGLFHIRSRKPDSSRNSNNCRLQKIDKTPYKVRVRWRPRAECLCATSSSQMNSSSAGAPGGRIGLRPLYEVNGRHIYLNGQNQCVHSQNSCVQLTSTENLLTQRSTTKNAHTRYNVGQHMNGTMASSTLPTLNNKRNNINAPRKSRRVKFVNLTTSTYHNKDVILNGTNFHHHVEHPRQDKNNTMNGGVLYTNYNHHNSSSSYHTIPINKSTSNVSLNTLKSLDQADNEPTRSSSSGGLFPKFCSTQNIHNDDPLEDVYTSTTFIVDKKL